MADDYLTQGLTGALVTGASKLIGEVLPAWTAQKAGLNADPLYAPQQQIDLAKARADAGANTTAGMLAQGLPGLATSPTFWIVAGAAVLGAVLLLRRR